MRRRTMRRSLMTMLTQEQASNVLVMAALRRWTAMGVRPARRLMMRFLRVTGRRLRGVTLVMART
jgi:hypothetical protein